MDACYGNYVRTVLSIEIIEIRNVLEVIGIDLSTFNNVIGLNIIGELNYLQGDTLLGKYILSNSKDFCMRSWRCSNRDLCTVQRIVVNVRIKTICRIFNYRNNCSVICRAYIICNLFAEKRCGESFYNRLIFISFLYAEDIYICGRGSFQTKSVSRGIEPGFESIVAVDYCEVNIFPNVC